MAMPLTGKSKRRERIERARRRSSRISRIIMKMSTRKGTGTRGRRKEVERLKGERK